MRFILLAVLSLLVLPPAAEAARRDERVSASRPQAAAKASRPAAAAMQGRGRTPMVRAAGAARQQATLRGGKPNAQRQASVRVGRQAPQQMARSRLVLRGRQVMASLAARPVPLRFGEVRTQQQSIVVRGAAAATVSRNLCSQRNGGTICGGPQDRGGTAGWQAGLPQPTYAQRDCPAGTFATLARGHDDVVRCMPI